MIKQGILALVFCLGFGTTFLAAQEVLWSSEAEDGIVGGSAEIASGCAHASGGYFVKPGSDAANSLSFEDITLKEAGSYGLRIRYFYNSEKSLEILVNGTSIGLIAFPAASWCYEGPPAQLLIPIDLQAGSNSLLLRPANGQSAPYLDYLELLSETEPRTEAASFYISATGDDTHDGYSPETAWQSLEKISALYLIPGDSIFFHSGDVFTGQLSLRGSGSTQNPIYVGSYGSGDLPVIDGAKAEGGAYLSAVLIQNQDHITMEGLEIRNERLVPRDGVTDLEGYGITVLNNGDRVLSNITFRGLTIRDVYSISTEGQDFNALRMAGIQLSSMKNSVAGKEKNISDVLIENCYFEHVGKFGIWSRHQGGDSGLGNDSINRNMNLVIRNNHFFETGGSGVVLSRTYNCLLEHNIFEYPGSDYDPRMPNRGSGAWFWKSMNVMAQYNQSLHVRGYMDSYGMHVDFGNRNIFLQYNYNEDVEGGFVEILGDNVHSVYRFNISVNDGFREEKGNTLWLSRWVGTTDYYIASDSSYIYNNSIYVSGDLSPDIAIKARSTFIYNNIFCATGTSSIGESTSVELEGDGVLHMRNNLYQGNVNMQFADYDEAPVLADPLFSDPGASNPDAYRLQEGSGALNAGHSFQEPIFPGAGYGIFADVPPVPETDFYGNPVSIGTSAPHIGAYNGSPLGVFVGQSATPGQAAKAFLEKESGRLHLQLEAAGSAVMDLKLHDLSGRLLYQTRCQIEAGQNEMLLETGLDLPTGIYLLSGQAGPWSFTLKLPLP